MSLAPGFRLGPYEIQAPLGAGGMGEVYRARDSRLQRDVAIKVLPEAVAGDPERLARFTREAQVLASLNHPHIAHVYGIEEGAGTRALVMELVEGEDLSERIARGPMPLDETLAIARQVAEALHAAHDAGIIHRDLKPANIKLRADGTVKVLDFGLAKAIDPAGSSPSLTHSPTVITPGMTRAGVILGTAAYMSPEQARGKTVDRRADIWAFGVVLLEMLTGRQVFGAETVSDTIAAVLTREPNLEALPAGTPPRVHRVLDRCLRKDPGTRFHHIADARIELEDTRADARAVSAESRAPQRAPWLVPLVVGLVAAAGAAGLTWSLTRRPIVATRPYTFTIPTAGFNTIANTAISPDGRWIAYSPNVEAAPFRLFVRALDSFESREIVSSSSTGINPFFSPDSQRVAFFTENALYKVAVSGGAPERIAALSPGIAHGAWGPNDTIVVSALFEAKNVIRRTLVRVPASGAEVVAITAPGPNEAHLEPEALPNGGIVLFTVAMPTTSSVAAVPIGGGPIRMVLTDARTPRYAASGHLLFQRVSSGDLMAAAFDASRGETTGEPVRIANVAQVIDTAAFSVAADGTLIYSAPTDTSAQSGFTLVSVDRSGVETPLLPQPGPWATPRVSPDGRAILYRRLFSPNCDLWVLDLARGTRTRVTFEGDNHDPIWRADGQISWSSQFTASRGIRMARADRPAQVTSLLESTNERIPESWSRDGTRLAFTELHPTTGRDISVLTVSSGAVRPFAVTPFQETQPAFSPDATWIAYASTESGRNEIYIQPSEVDGGRIQISTNGGNSPLWSPDGRELFYFEGSQLMMVDVNGRTSPPETSRPRLLLKGPYVWERPGNVDITPDGRRFVFVRRDEGSDPSATLRVILNWPAQFMRTKN